LFLYFFCFVVVVVVFRSWYHLILQAWYFANILKIDIFAIHWCADINSRNIITIVNQKCMAKFVLGFYFEREISENKTYSKCYHHYPDVIKVG
jgi:hypothetical protein